MPGGFGTPYRPPCPGTWPPAPKAYLSGCGGSMTVEADKAVQKWTNKTRVTDPATDGSGNPVNPEGVPPYARRRTMPGIPSCADQSPPCPNVPPDPSTAIPKCGPWPIAERGEKNHAPDGDHVWVDYNVYERIAGETIDLSKCRKLGFKNVQAEKLWHGHLGWNLPDGCTSTSPVGCSCPAYEPYRGTPRRTRWLTADFHLTYDHNFSIAAGDSVDQTNHFDIRNTNSIAKLTGKKTISNCYAHWILDGVLQDPGIDWWSSDTDGDRGLAYALGHLSIDCNMNVGSSVANGQVPIYMENINHAIKGEPLTEDAFDNWTIIVTVAPNSFDLDITRVLSDGLGHSNTVTWQVHYDLTDAYTDAEVYADACVLLNEWKLNDDKVYPWREDEKVTIGPYVRRHEALNVPSFGWPDVCEEPAWNYDGHIIGSPLPAGYGPHFDWDHENWKFCTDEFGGQAFYVYSYGAFTPSDLPQTATFWSDQHGPRGGDQFWPGAWAWYNTATNAVVVQKWAEILVPRPSYNFFRPCGKDRYMLDETKSGCVSSFTGSGTAGNPYVLTVAFSVATPTIANGTACYYSGKIWPLVSSAANVFTLSDTATANVPALALQEDSTFGPLRFPAAWPIGGRVSVVSATQNAGNVDVVIAGANETGDADWLRTADLVDFSGVTGLGTNLAVTVTDATHFSVPGTLSGAYTSGGFVKSSGAPAYQWFDSQPKGDYAMLEWLHDYRDISEADRTCAQAHACNCPEITAPYGCVQVELDPVGAPGVLTWVSTLRRQQVLYGMPRSLKTFTPTTHCLERNPCSPTVVCISPNGETWASGRTHDFPRDAEGNLNLVADGQFGSLWQKTVYNNRQDILYQFPHRSCDGYDAEGDYNFCWIEDDGLCNADGDCRSINPTLPVGTPLLYYPMRPWVEALIVLPTGAPALPVGLHMGFLTLAELDVAGVTEGNVGAPPPNAGLCGSEPNIDACTFVTPWGNFIRQEFCVCATGRFAESYKQNGVSC